MTPTSAPRISFTTPQEELQEIAANAEETPEMRRMARVEIDRRERAQAPAVQPKKNITLILGSRGTAYSPHNLAATVSKQSPAILPASPVRGTKLGGPPMEQSVQIRYHETVIDILKDVRQPTDGSVVMLMPGSGTPFEMDASPYEHVSDGGTLEVVPNPGQPEQQEPEHVEPAPEPYRAKLLSSEDWRPEPDELYTLEQSPGYWTRPDVLVEDAESEALARANGFTVEIPAPS